MFKINEYDLPILHLPLHPTKKLRITFHKGSACTTRFWFVGLLNDHYVTNLLMSVPKIML